MGKFGEHYICQIGLWILTLATYGHMHVHIAHLLYIDVFVIWRGSLNLPIRQIPYG